MATKRKEPPSQLEGPPVGVELLGQTTGHRDLPYVIETTDGLIGLRVDEPPGSPVLSPELDDEDTVRDDLVGGEPEGPDTHTAPRPEQASGGAGVRQGPTIETNATLPADRSTVDETAHQPVPNEEAGAGDDSPPAANRKTWVRLRKALVVLGGLALAALVTAIVNHAYKVYIEQPTSDGPSLPLPPQPAVRIVATGTYHPFTAPPEVLAAIESLKDNIRSLRDDHNKRSHRDRNAIDFWKHYHLPNPSEPTPAEKRKLLEGERELHEYLQELEKSPRDSAEPAESRTTSKCPGSCDIVYSNDPEAFWPKHRWDITIRNSGVTKAEEVDLEVPNRSTFKVHRRGETIVSSEGVSVIHIGAIAAEQEIRVEVWPPHDNRSSLWVQHTQGRVKVEITP